uniref:Uncharacterized protein n=1 Tax=Acrobeloides nanus TaxID=290746 RepID=A0A914E2M8_9BILA
MLMIFVLYQIYSSLAIVKILDQKRLLMERKRIAWVIVAQSGINFVLSAFRVIAFMNIANIFGGGKTMGCYGPFLNFYDQDGYFFQELFVCLDGLMYIFFLTPYREELFRFVKKILRRDKVHVITVSSQSNVIRAANIAR